MIKAKAHGWHQQNRVMEMPRSSWVGVGKLLTVSGPRVGGSSSITGALDGEKACWNLYNKDVICKMLLRHEA